MFEFENVFLDSDGENNLTYHYYYYLTPAGYCYLQIIRYSDDGYVCIRRPRRISEAEFERAYDYNRNH